MIRVGLVGYGFAGKTLHAPYIIRVPELKLKVIASSSKEKVLADFPDAIVVSSYEEACTHPEVDLVVLATPNLTHYSLTKLALENDKHVVCDKPFTQTTAEARELVALAKSKGKHLCVYQNRRFDAEFLGIKEALKTGKIGEPRLYESRFDRLRPVVRDRWREKDQPCSGLWWDLGPHVIDQALVLFGLPKSVNLSLARQRGTNQADDFAHAVLDYGSLQVVMNAAVCVRTPLAARLTIHGTEASAQVPHLDCQETQILQGMTPDHPDFGINPENRITIYRGDNPKEPNVIQSETLSLPRGEHIEFYRKLAKAIEDSSAQPPVHTAYAVALMHILEGAEQAAREGKHFNLELSEDEIKDFESARSTL